MIEKIQLALKGMAMGVAEVIPGVSGGTIAFISGIYEKLLDTINSFNFSLIREFREGGIRRVWQKINGNFLAVLLTGMFTGLVVGVFGVTHLMENYPKFLWAFFFGLIISSTFYIGRQVTRWGVGEIVAILAGTGIAYYYTIASPTQGNEALWFVFVSGVIAISALMLPGISGSFMLLLMGMYTLIIPSVKQVLLTFEMKSLVIVIVFGLGCLTGLLTFARVLSWTLKHYRLQTMALLTGFMIGSLNKLWPWKNVLSYRENSHGEMIPFTEISVFPLNYEGDPQTMGVILMAVIGFLSVFLIERFGSKRAVPQH